MSVVVRGAAVVVIAFGAMLAVPIAASAQITGPPEVTGISPAVGSTVTGAIVTITGFGFNGATGVTFGTGGFGDYEVDSPTQIEVAAPPHAAGRVNVRVTTPLGTSAVTTADLFTYKVLPIVDSISPSTGSIAGGTSVTVMGSGFSGTTQVLFGNGNPGSVTGLASDSLTVTAPSHAAGTVNLRVVTPDGESAVRESDVFTFEAPAPVVTEISPSSGTTAGATLVTVTGTGLTGTTKVLFGNGSPGTIEGVTSTLLQVSAPAHAAGRVNVRVVTAGGTSAVTPSDVFEFRAPPPPPPVIDSVSPASGPTEGGGTVTISGSGFDGATQVLFGNGIPGTITGVASDSITVTAPTHSGGIVNIRVVGPGGESAAVAGDRYTYTAG